MKLFDTVKDGHYLKKWDQPIFDYFNRSPREAIVAAGNLLESWFEKFPENGKKDLRERFRSPKNEHHLGAFFELYIHELFSCLGYSLLSHPEMRNSQCSPDFLALRNGNRSFYVEATVAFPSKSESTSKSIIERVYASLDNIDSPNFFLYIKHSGTPTVSPSGKNLGTELEKWLSTLDPKEIGERLRTKGIGSLPKYERSYSGWNLSFIPLPKSAEKRGKIGVRPIGIDMPETKNIQSHLSIRSAITTKKASKYGDMDLPYIIAVNVIDDFAEISDIMDGLLGDENVMVFQRKNGSRGMRSDRNFNGAWRGPEGWKNTRVSAALMTVNMLPLTLLVAPVNLIHHPMAARPFPTTEWPCNQYMPNLAKNMYELIPGQSTSCQIMNLPLSWQVPDKKQSSYGLS